MIKADTVGEAARLHALLRAHGEVTADAFCENLVAAALSGSRMPRGNKGFDVRCPSLGRIEVRSRMIGTDGDNPRISIRSAPPWSFDVLMAVRITPDFLVHGAWMFPATSLVPLYVYFRQKPKALAHLPWRQAVALPGAKDVTARLAAVLASGAASATTA